MITDSFSRGRARKWSLVAATVLVAGAMAAPVSAAPAETIALATQIDRLAQKAIDDGESVGLQVAVMKGGREILAKGYGLANLEHKSPVTVDTRFRIGSITKQITAAAILLLAEDGKLSLDDPLARFFPDFPRGGEVTVHQLLSHTSGLHNYTENEPNVRDYLPGQTTADRVAYIAAQPKLYDFEPGTNWTYSNSAYFMLGAIVEKVSGRSFGAFLKERIFDRLGMTHSALDSENEIVPGRAAGYTMSTEKPYAIENAPFFLIGIHGGAGALRSTVRDLGKWQQALYGGRLLKPGSLERMTSPVRLKDGRLASSVPGTFLAKVKIFDGGYGLMLWNPENGSKIGHGGGMPGFAASMNTYRKEDVAVIVLSNTTGGPAGAGSEVADAIERLVLASSTK